jgi:hypothetical protein
MDNKFFETIAERRPQKFFILTERILLLLSLVLRCLLAAYPLNQALSCPESFQMNVNGSSEQKIQFEGGG